MTTLEATSAPASRASAGTIRLGIAHYLGFEVALRVRRRLLPRAYRSSSPVRGPPVGRPGCETPALRAAARGCKPAAEALRDFAEETLAHSFDLLGSGPYRSANTSTGTATSRVVTCGQLVPYLDVVVTRLDDDSDAKVPWELSRSHHLVGLARAAVLFRDERYAQELERQLEEWLTANPPGFGINWVNPWRPRFAPSIGSGPSERSSSGGRWMRALRRRVSRSLGMHARHIMANLEGTPFLRSNHYTADVLGLLVLGHCLRGDLGQAAMACSTPLALCDVRPPARSWMTA